MMTTVTTVVGLVPIMLERNFQAQFMIPMAVSLAFGVGFATLISLYLVPSLVLVGDDLMQPFGGGALPTGEYIPDYDESHEGMRVTDSAYRLNERSKGVRLVAREE